jgi:hypothetical protein
MKSLKDLHILLWTVTPFGTPSQWKQGVKELLTLLRRIRPKNHYCLTIHEPEVEELTDLCRDAPFTLNWKDAVTSDED